MTKGAKKPAVKQPAKAKRPPAPRTTAVKKVKRGEQRDKLEEIGIDAFCERITKGESVGQIADALGMERSTAWRWIEADAQRSVRVRASLEASAHAYDEMAVEAINALQPGATQAEIAKARELASHYRWRASKRNPRVYGDKLDLNHSGKVEMTDEQVSTRLALLLGKAGLNKAG